MAKDSDNNPPSIFLPRLDEADGPALPLSDSERLEGVRAALLACGLDGVSAPKSLGGGIAPKPSDAARPSGSYRIPETPASDATKAVRTSSSPWGRRSIKTAIVVGVIASSSAAAALSANWRDITSWFEANESTTSVASNPPLLTARLTSIANNAPKPAPIETEAPIVEEPAVLEATPMAPPAAKVTSPSPVSKDVEATKASTPQAEDLLGAANALRAQRRYPEALARYLQVVREHPSSPQAAAARVSAATLRLEHGNDANGALELLEGAPSERRKIPEAEFLVAESYRAQGNANHERQALQRFLSRSPDHPLASKARRRLEILKSERNEELR